MSRCSIGPTGAAEIAEYVSGSGVLKSIDLSMNNIDEGKGSSKFFGRKNGKREGKAVIRDAVSGREGFELRM